VGEHEHAFWAGSIVNAAHNHVLHDMHEVPAWVPLAPTVVGVLGIALAYFLYMVAPGLPARLRSRRSRGLYRFLLNKWYFDELYDRSSSARPAARPRVLEGRRRRIIDGHAERRRRPRRGGRARGGAHPDRAGGELRLRHDHRPRPVRLDPALRCPMNAAGFPLLSLVTFLPLAGAFIILMVRGEEAVVTPQCALDGTLGKPDHAGAVAHSLGAVRPIERRIPVRRTAGMAARLRRFYQMGVDGISVLFVLLSTVLVPLCILASWESVQTRVREYMVAFLVLESMMVGMFCALDFVLFYIFFEAVLIPMFLIIGVWGGARRVYAAFKFFLYTLAARCSCCWRCWPCGTRPAPPTSRR
jgi:NADH:ubiquinone oxidoreductase subunit 5 (subunit L)/multisubunit Na+/H+ antiporter MnhA subunit